MALTSTLVSVEEYLSTGYRPDCEYLEGTVLERNVGEFEHSRSQTNLASYCRVREKQWGIVALTEQRVQVTTERFRVPDVCVLKAGASRDPVLLRPPFLCIEILSKNDTMTEMQERIDDYLAMGVPFVWVVDPRRRRGHVYTESGRLEVAEAGVLRTSSPDMEVPLAEIFEGI